MDATCGGFMKREDLIVWLWHINAIISAADVHVCTTLAVSTWWFSAASIFMLVSEWLIVYFDYLICMLSYVQHKFVFDKKHQPGLIVRHKQKQSERYLGRRYARHWRFAH